MRRMLIGGVLLAAAAMAYPGVSGAEYSYGVAQVSSKKLLVTFNDNTKCGLHVNVKREGSNAVSNARYYCYDGKTKQPLKKPIRVVVVNGAGEWLNFNRGKRERTITECAGYQCDAKPSTLSNVKSNKRPTGNAVFHIYYTRNAGYFVPVPGCEYVRDDKGKGPPGYRMTCAIQAR